MELPKSIIDKSNCRQIGTGAMHHLPLRGAGPPWRLIAGILLCLLLVFSVIPSYAVLDYRTFDGTFLDVTNSSKLQLTQFTIEVRFRYSEEILERGYLLSKVSGTNENLLQDQNYALFLTPQSKLGGGFRALDGSYQYVYSPAVSADQWHVAKLVFDGSSLRLSLDGSNVASKTTGKEPDSRGTGPLRIGANANGAADKFFLGDLDYLKIIDRKISTRVYYNDFTQESAASDECSSIPIDRLHGTVFIDPLLARFEDDSGPSSPQGYLRDSMKYIKSNGMNLVRVPFYWESYLSWPSAFLNELELVAQEAQANDICVIFDNHHWYTSSYFANLDNGKSGTPKGFPSFVMEGYPTTGDYEQVAGSFWEDFLTNDIIIGGQKIWDIQADFLGKVIKRVDQYRSVAGYEILNEPHIFDPSQYSDLGNYHTYMAKKIRSVTDKKIVFDRETTRGFQRDPGQEYKIVPQGVSGLVYGPHLYSVPVAGSQGEKQVQNFKQWSDEWDVEILIGEWSAETQDEMDTFVTVFENSNFGWTYYKWSPAKDTDGTHLGNVIYESNNTPKTVYLKYLANSIQKIL